MSEPTKDEICKSIIARITGRGKVQVDELFAKYNDDERKAIFDSRLNVSEKDPMIFEVDPQKYQTAHNTFVARMLDEQKATSVETENENEEIEPSE